MIAEEYKQLLLKYAPIICCPLCKDRKCYGRGSCPELKAYVKRKLETDEEIEVEENAESPNV